MAKNHENIQNYKKECRFQVSHWSAVLCRNYAQFSYAWPCMCVFCGRSPWLSTEIDICEVFSFCLKKSLTMKTSHPKMPSHQTRKLQSRDRENTAYLKTVLHWKKDLTIDLGYKLSKLESCGGSMV